MPDGPESCWGPMETSEGRAEALVFVYGTLKRGERNHGWLAEAPFLGEATLEGITLHDLGPFPMAVAGEGRCHGEIYAVKPKELLQLDALEGYPRLYDRRLMELVDGRRVWVYLGRARQVRHSRRLAEGRWRGSPGGLQPRPADPRPHPR